MRIGARAAAWQPRVALVTGAGPVGLLAALIGVQRGLEMHVLDRMRDGVKPELVRALGATYHVRRSRCAQAGHRDRMHRRRRGRARRSSRRTAPDGIVCLAGVSSGGHKIKFDIGDLNREMVLENHVVFGSVNANRRHYRAAAEALAKADKKLACAA